MSSSRLAAEKEGTSAPGVRQEEQQTEAHDRGQRLERRRMQQMRVRGAKP
jgi:hypothetical protein